MYSATVVGSGFGAWHINMLQRTGVCDVRRLIYRADTERAERVAREFGVQEISKNLDDAYLDDTNLLVVCTPVDTHYEICANALKRRMMVACDKPLCIKPAEANELAEASEKIGVPTFVCFQWRWSAGIQVLKEAIDLGALGRIREVHTSFDHDFLAERRSEWEWRHSYSRAGAGAIGDLGVHLIDLHVWLISEKPRVCGVVAWRCFETREGENYSVLRCETEDMANVSFIYDKSKVIGSMRVSRVAKKKRGISISVHGDKGSVDLSISAETGEHTFIWHGSKMSRLSGDAVSENPYDHWLSSDSKTRETVPTFRSGAVVQDILNEILSYDVKTVQ